MADQGKKKKSRAQPEEVREQQLTYDDYAALDDGLRYELADGKLELMTAPQVGHQAVISQLLIRLHESCGSAYFILPAPVDVILSSHEVRQPDLVVIRNDRLDIVSKRGVEGSPDVVVEILSPSTARRDKLDKLKVYARYGIPEYWIVSPEAGCLEQYGLEGDRYELTGVYEGDEPIVSPNLPCASFTMAEVLSRVPKLRDN